MVNDQVKNLSGYGPAVRVIIRLGVRLHEVMAQLTPRGIQLTPLRDAGKNPRPSVNGTVIRITKAWAKGEPAYVPRDWHFSARLLGLFDECDDIFQ